MLTQITVSHTAFSTVFTPLFRTIFPTTGQFIAQVHRKHEQTNKSLYEAQKTSMKNASVLLLIMRQQKGKQTGQKLICRKIQAL